MSGNYNLILDQLLGLGKWSQSVYESAKRDQERKRKIREEVFGFRNSEDPLHISIEKSRKTLETYLHDFGNPKDVPDLLFNHLDDIKRLIQAVSKATESEWYTKAELEEIMDVLCDRYVAVASKILRVAFEPRSPPMQLPNPNDLYVPRQDSGIASAFKVK